MPSRVIGIRITPDEKFLWETFARTQNRPIGQIITHAISLFLNPYSIYSHESTISSFISSIETQLKKNSILDKNKENNIKKKNSSKNLNKNSDKNSDNNSDKKLDKNLSLIPFTFRVDSEDLAEWDSFAKQNFYTRSSLIRQAMHAYFSPEIQFQIKSIQKPQLNVIKELLYNIIHRLGQTSYDEIVDLFTPIDKSLIRQLLQQLENEERIFRTWHDEYITYAKHENVENELFD
ncbi:MAG: hypothetical protein K9W44_06230 [Candidatus Lokiarchaeota archaeon]|nr:hypothetical protein [Candidatus Harpocratesius repetitus]